MLALQEVGDAASLDDLLARIGGTWQTTVSTHPDPRGIRVAFASRLPIVSSREVTVFTAGLAPIQSDDTGGTATPPSRGFLQISVTVPGVGDVHIVTAHLKSKLLTYPGRPVPIPR